MPDAHQPFVPHGDDAACERTADAPHSVRGRLLVLNERDPAHPRAGGAEIHVARIFSRLAARSWRVTWLATGFRGAAKREAIDGITIERGGPLPLYYARVPFRVRSATGRGEFDLVVDCLNKIPYYAPLYARAPVLALCHHLFGEVAFAQASWPIAAAVVLAESGLARAYRRTPFLAISPSTAADLAARGLPSDLVDVSLPGIDPPRYAVDPAAHRPPRLAYVGRLERYKHVDVMLRAGARLVERCPDLELLVIGRGAERARLERLARELGLAGRTRFTGFVPESERDALLAGARVCVFPSDKEGWGLTVIEANALGTPVVARDAPGLRDSVRHGETGRLVADDAPIESWVEAIGALLVEDDAAVALRGRCLAWSQRFDWDRAADETEAAILRALAGEPGRAAAEPHR